jgi:hypothetical protein
MTDKNVIRIIHRCLKARDQWYIDFICPEIDEFETIVQKAKSEADKRLSKLSVFSFQRRYKKWKKSDPIIGRDEHYFHAFINSVCFDLGLLALRGNERDLYNESCYLELKFLY